MIPSSRDGDEVAAKRPGCNATVDIGSIAILPPGGFFPCGSGARVKPLDLIVGCA